MDRGKEQQKRQFLIWALISGIMAIGVFAFVFLSSEDIVYSDYIRLVNEYLPDVLDVRKLLVPDILTRTPIAFFFRIVNVSLFHYSVTFDRVLNVVFLLAASLILLWYGKKEKLSPWFFAPLLLLQYSLSKAEMLINGTGYPHFLAYVFFYLHFFLIDRIYQNTGSKKDIVWLCVIPWVTILLMAGPYCAVYVVTILLLYFFLFREKPEIGKKDRFLPVFCILAPFLLYMISNHFAVEETPGMSDVGLWEAVAADPGYAVRFLLNGFASAAVDGEWLQDLELEGRISSAAIYGIGAAVILGYAAAFYIYFKEGIFRKTFFPAALLLLGFGSHLIVFLGRYGFLWDGYSMSSRYFLQYQQGLLGILLTVALTVREKRDAHYRKKKDSFLYRKARGILCIVAAAVFIGNAASTVHEIRGIGERKEVFRLMKEVELNYQKESDEVLDILFEYGAGADKIRSAFRILEENDLNVFYNSK